jgi:hypothetical protein
LIAAARAVTLAGDAAGWRCGLGVLQHRGVVAWLRAWQAVPAAAASTAAGEPTSALHSCGVADRLVDALASMALAVAAGR